MSSLPTPIQRPPATTLEEAADMAVLGPLAPEDSRYVELTEGHRRDGLDRLRRRLDRAFRTNGEPVKLVLTGHRGCGKTTELLRIKRDYANRFYPLYLELDSNLHKDFDYTLLMLWVCEELARQMDAEGMPLDPREVEVVASWFAERTQTVTEIRSIEAKVEAEAEARGGLALLPGIGLRMLARLRMQASGNQESRRQIKTALQNSAGDLIARVNGLLATAQRILLSHNRPARILVIQDNLDRLDKDTARTLFGDEGTNLLRLEADFIFTAPLRQSLSPLHLNQVFPETYDLPTITVRHRDGAVNPEGIDTLCALLAKRLNIGVLVPGRADIETLCLLSGGSVRDLVRLLGLAAEYADADNRPAIDADAIARAAIAARKEYQGILVPERVYFPRLATIHLEKNDGFTGKSDMDPRQADLERDHFCQMLINGTVLEYGNGENWYDVHPLVQDLKAFKHALAARHAAAQTSAAAPA